MKTFAAVGYFTYLGLSYIDFAGLVTRLKHLLKVVIILVDKLN